MPVAALLCLGLVLPPGSAASTIDALLATVGSHVIMLSDVRLATALQVFDVTAPGLVLQRLIDRSLMLAEVERFQPPEPVPARIDDGMNVLRARLGTVAWTSALRNAGVDEAYVRAMVRDNLRLEAYLLQRFGTLAEPSEEEVSAAVAAPPGPGSPNTRAGAQEQLRSSRYAALVSQWLAELRTRNDVSVREVSQGVLDPARE